jgi:DNA-directed RNA polymerase specialized sigma24 family protein
MGWPRTLVPVDGKQLSLREAAKVLRIPYRTLQRRRHRGRPIDAPYKPRCFD